MKFVYVFLSSSLLLLFSLNPSSAAEPKYEDLKTSGFVTSKMSRNAAGSIGWVVSKGSERFFCRGFLGVENNGNDLKNGKPRPDQVGRCSKLK